MEYDIDILEPTADWNKSIDVLAKSIGALYKKSWDQTKAKHYGGKPFALNIQALSGMWLQGMMKIFIAVDRTTRDAQGFLAAVVFRPMYYQANVFQIQDWYAPGADLEKQLFDFAINASRFMGVDEIWVQSTADMCQQPPKGWHEDGHYVIQRFVKE